ncbi:kinesin light chain 1 [Xylaria cubensis]|nr:kinesin light chain 1 [Xylaria cubensis]
MRLLQRQDDRSLTLTTFPDDDIPPYGILSHTWGEEDEEVTFREIIEGVTLQKYDYKQKKGYRKIDFCANAVANDKLQYFWVDSGCIDKSSSAELQEAITSMFRWYQNAVKCYVYLSDVPRDNEQYQRASSRPAWEFAFRKSRWFTRGWTLHELLAPRCVVFFSKDGHKLGSRPELDQLLHEVTGIAIDALQGKPLSEFSRSERMSWARGRQTKRKEDKAYSLLGIFNVSIYIAYGEGEELAMDRLHAEIDRRLGLLRTRESHFMVPFGRNKNFVGRDAILESLLEKIPPSANKDDCQRTALEGLGGTGKTQVALEAACRVRKTHPDYSIFWVPAIDLTSFETAYREIGQLLQLPGIDDDKADVKTLVKTALSQESAGHWLLIIDNADDSELLSKTLADYLPFSREGSILFTTRNHKTTAILDIERESIFAISEMNDGEATDLLRKGLRKEQLDSIESIQRLLSFLTNLPLAIKQASAFMASNTNVTVSKYLEFCESSDTDLIKILSKEFENRYRYKSHAKNQNPVATTWLISFDNISRYDPQAADFLKFMCFLAEKNIPVSLLPVTSKIEMKKAIGTLKAYAFIIERGTPEAFDIHRLIRLVMRNWLQQKGEWETRYANVVLRLTKEYPSPEKNNTYLLFRIAKSYSMLGKYNKAERLYQQTLRLRKEVLGREHPDTLSSMNNLGNAFNNQGKYKEAEEIYRKTLELRKKVLGKMHPDTLGSMNNLGNALYNQRNYEKAEGIYRQTLELKKKVLGKEHSDILGSMKNLGNVLYNQGKYEEAEGIYRQTLELRKRVLGKEHPATLCSMKNLGNVLYNQGKYEEAEGIYRKTLELEQKVLGRKHPATLCSMYNLGKVLNSQGKYEEAEGIYRKTIELKKKVLGREHPDTLCSMYNLGNVLYNQWKDEEAKGIYRQTLELRKKVLGREHPDVLRSIESLASVLGG